MNQLTQKEKLLEAKRDDIEEYDKIRENILRGKSKCNKMISAANLNDAKTLLKAESDNDLERYSTRTIGMYKKAVNELKKRKEREKR